MANAFNIGGTLDIGYSVEKQEDYFAFKELDDENMFVVIADGTGSVNESLQPAPLVVGDITDTITKIYKEDKDFFMSKPDILIKYAMFGANKLLGAFKMGNEQMYSGYAASVSCLLLTKGENGKSRINIGHSGNTRIYLLRDGNLKQMTEDHTKARELQSEGVLTQETYYLSPDRLKITSGLGLVTDPVIQTLSGKIRDTDIILMTTDGIHYAIREQYIPQIVLQSMNCEEAASLLTSAARTTKFPDNATAVVISTRK